MATGAYKDIFPKLTEVVDQLKNNNASLTAQLSDSMKINLGVDKKLNIQSAQGKDPKGNMLENKSNRKATFERNLYPIGYCWTHGFRVTKQHSSQTCSKPAAGHQNTATRQNILGGSEAGK